MPIDINANSIRPGLGQSQGVIQPPTVASTPSAFQAVRPSPGAFSAYVGYQRINLVWIPAGSDGYQIVFGPDTASIVVGSFVGSPVFKVGAGIQRWLLLSTDLGFKVQQDGVGTNNLYWWFG